MRGKLISTILFLFALPLTAQERSAIYVGTSRGLFWSKDGGNSWQRTRAKTMHCSISKRERRSPD
jgi:hypothetical protein